MPKQQPDAYGSLRNNGRIRARIIDAKTGLTQLEGIYAVRIHSKNLNVLIMNDYLPTLGQVHGNVTFLDAKKEHLYANVHGFYKHQHNEFTLLIEDYYPEKGADTP